MSFKKVLVFGPTGGVGSIVARTAHSLGAKVFLAMRDTSKSIPGLSPAEEQKSNLYERVQADLSQPNSVHAAVSKTGATHAFIYATLGTSPDHMRSTAEALKAGGVKRVVLLSSFAVQGGIRTVQPSNFIGYEHAQVEISLEDIFGPQGYVAVRPSFFASNSLWWQKQIVEDKEVKWAFPDLKFDYITPEDIGAVCGTILAGAVDGEHESPIILLGAEEDLTVADAIEAIANAIKQPVKVTKVSQDEHLQILISKSGLLEPMAKVLTSNFAGLNERLATVKEPLDPKLKANVEKILKRPTMRFAEWAERNKDKFEA
jgi:uncharacterized protein YbjT (DUF2867 family)